MNDVGELEIAFRVLGVGRKDLGILSDLVVCESCVSKLEIEMPDGSWKPRRTELGRKGHKYTQQAREEASAGLDSY